MSELLLVLLSLCAFKPPAPPMRSACGVPALSQIHALKMVAPLLARAGSIAPPDPVLAALVSEGFWVGDPGWERSHS